MKQLPRPLRDERLLALLEALDNQHAVLGLERRGKGSWSVTVHYPPDGSPAVAQVQTTMEVPLGAAARKSLDEMGQEAPSSFRPT